MAIVALHSAATGLSAMSQDIDVIAHNIANTNTNGFKALRSNFEDLLYQQKEQPGVENARGDQRPAGLFVGLGTRISNTQLDLTVGSAIPDTGDFSMMIQGQGFFQVSLGEETGFTRAGNFFKNSEGDLVLGTANGPRLEPPVNIPANANRFIIQGDGTILGFLDNDSTETEFGTIILANFTNPTGLKPIGENIFLETPASGPPIESPPQEGSFGTLLHKFLESSNVDPVRELINLIKTQRNFEFNSQSIQAADQSLQVIANLRQF